jgi:hypothetical protein
MLMLTCVSFYGKIRLYVAYMKMIKCSNDSIMIDFALFVEIGFLIFTFMYRSHMIVFLFQNLHTKCQHNIYMRVFLKKIIKF